MALIKCPECGREISDTCDVCIHCGYKLKNNKNESSGPSKGEAKEVIADRTGAGNFFAVYIIDIALGIGLAILFIIMAAVTKGFTNLNPGLLVMYYIVFFIGLFAIAAGFVGLSWVNKNNKIQGDCILHDKAKDVLVLNTIDGRTIEIKPQQYVKIKCGALSTDKILIIYYNDNSGKVQKTRLGYTSNATRSEALLISLSHK